MCECRFWPVIQQVHKPSNTWLKLVPVSPSKVEGALKSKKGALAAWDQDVDMCQHLIHGPFDFVAAPQVSGKSPGRSHTISPLDWDALKRQASSYDVDASDVDQVDPLK